MLVLGVATLVARVEAAEEELDGVPHDSSASKTADAACAGATFAPGERTMEPTAFFVQPSGDRDRWEVDYEKGAAIRWHAKPRQQLFVPGHCSGGPELSLLTGERATYTKFPSGQVRVVSDNYLQMTKPEWKGRAKLRMRAEAKAPSKGKKR